MTGESPATGQPIWSSEELGTTPGGGVLGGTADGRTWFWVGRRE